jgi:hypothetical protein
MRYDLQIKKCSRGIPLTASLTATLYGWQSETLQYSAARRTRKQIVLVLFLVLVLDCPIADYENKDDDEDESFERSALDCGDITSQIPVRSVLQRVL